MILSRPANAPPQYEQDVRCVHLQEFLLRVLTATLWRHGGYGAFHDLQQRLLHALTRHITGDGWVVRLAGDLVDFVNVDDAALCAFDIVFRRLQQLEDDVFDIFANIARLRSAWWRRPL